MFRKSSLLIVVSCVALLTVVCSSSPLADNSANESAAKIQDLEIEFVRKRFREHDARLPGMMWSLSHNYSDKDESIELLGFFSNFSRGLFDSDPDGLKKLGGLQKIKDKFAAYTESKDGAVRGFAALVLGIFGDKKYAPLLARLIDGKKQFKSDLEEMTDASRGQAAIALSIMGATEFEEKVITLLKTSSGSNRSGAITALIGLGGKKHARVVVDVMLDKNAYDVDKTAPLSFLLETGAAADYKKQLIGLLHSSLDSEQRVAIIYLFVKLNAEDTKTEIAKLLNNEFVKGDAAKALALMNAVEYENKIATLLSDRKSLVRQDAALALGLLKSQKHALAVSKLLTAKEDFVRLYAAIALVMMDVKPYLSAAIPIVDQFKTQGAYLNPGDFHPFVAEKGEVLIKAFGERLKSARGNQ